MRGAALLCGLAVLAVSGIGLASWQSHPQANPAHWSPCLHADAGPDSTAWEGQPIVLDGSASSAGTTWVKDSSNPVLRSGPGGWDGGEAGLPAVLKDGSLYRMWDSGFAGSDDIGVAESYDGLSWTKYAGNPVLSPAAGWESSHVFGATVLKVGGLYKMWYTGSDGTHYQVGYAEAPDGISWSPHAGNPVLPLGDAGSWDDYHVAD